MSIHYLIEKHDDIEDATINALKEYFNEKIGFDKIMPKFAPLRVSETHPFTIANIAVLNGQEVPGNLFPSVTVTAVDDNPDPQLLNKEKIDPQEFDEEWITEQEANKLVDKEQVLALKSIITTESRNLFGVSYTDRFKERLVFSIWSENRIVRSFLYTHVRAFMHLYQQMFLDANFDNYVMNGTPSGLYNVDYGRTLYGAEIAVMGDRHFLSAMINTEIVSIAEVEHYIDTIETG